MVTANKFLEQPARGSNVGVWDTPVNANTGIIDNSFGGMATIALTNSPVILSSAQYQCVFITFTGALSGTCPITLPAVGSFYTVQNLTSNTSAFQVTLGTSLAGTQVIGCPWGEPFDIMTDNVGNVKFRNLGRVGTYADFAGSAVPAWVSACTVPPYLNCTGAVFSSATYPVLATLLGGTTLPDSRGRYRAAMDQGTSRLVSVGGFGIDGNTLLAGGGSPTLAQANLPNVSFPVTDPGHSHTFAGSTAIGATGGAQSVYFPGGTTVTSTTVTNITVNSGGSGALVYPPGFAGGITMIRAG